MSKSNIKSKTLPVHNAAAAADASDISHPVASTAGFQTLPYTNTNTPKSFKTKFQITTENDLVDLTMGNLEEDPNEIEDDDDIVVIDGDKKPSPDLVDQLLETNRLLQRENHQLSEKVHRLKKANTELQGMKCGQMSGRKRAKHSQPGIPLSSTEKLTSLQNDLGAVMKELAASKAKETALDKERETAIDMEKELEGTKEEASKLLLELENSNDAISEMKDQLNAVEAKLKLTIDKEMSLQEQLEQSDGHAAALTRELGALKNDHAVLGKKLVAADASISAEKNKVNMAKTLNNELQKTLADASQTVLNLIAKLLACHKELQTPCTALADHSHGLMSAAYPSHVAGGRIKSGLETLLQIVDETAKELRVAVHGKAEILNAHSLVEKEKELLSKDLALTRATVASHSCKLFSLQNELDTVGKENKVLRDDFAKVIDDRTALVNEVAVCQQSLVAASDDVNRLNADLATLRAAHNIVVSQKAAADGLVLQLETRLKREVDERDCLVNAVKAAYAAKHDLQEEANMARIDCIKLEKSLTESNKSIAALKLELEAVRSGQTKELDQLGSEFDKFREAARSQAEQWGRSVSEKDDLIGKLRQQMEEQAAEVKDVEDGAVCAVS